MKFILKTFLLLSLIKIFIVGPSLASENNIEFKKWLISFKKEAISKGISKETVSMIFIAQFKLIFTS